MSAGENKYTGKKAFVLILAIWLVINLLQAIFTGMSSDESYYSLWGKNLAWGYFDHPPMIAFFTLVSSIFFDGGLGVRFMTVLAQIGTLLIVWKLIDDKNAGKRDVQTFFIVASSLIMFAALGFTTTPDSPLLFFVALFLLSYKRFLNEESTVNIILLSLSMAGMVYSKYQSSLVIGLILISNLNLLLKPKFWLAGIMSLTLLFPHFYWQYENNFPSFQYHLVDRSNQFQLKYFLEYFPNQIAVFNPFTLGLVLYIIFKNRFKDIFEKGLYFLIVGFIIFFWFTAYRGHVEPHWTVACSLPMIILVYERAKSSETIRKFIFTYVLGSLIIIFIARIALFIPPMAVKFSYSEKDRFEAIESIAGELPVVFNGSFQAPSLYTYFTENKSTTISSIYNRRTQFDVWQFEREFEGKSVFICAQIDGLSKNYTVKGEKFDGFIVDNFHSALRLNVDFKPLTETAIKAGDTIRTSFSIYNPYPFTIEFNNDEFPLKLCACFATRKFKSINSVVSSRQIVSIKSLEKINGELYTIVPVIPEGEYAFSINIESIFGPSIERGLTNAKNKTIRIQKND